MYIKKYSNIIFPATLRSHRSANAELDKSAKYPCDRRNGL